MGLPEAVARRFRRWLGISEGQADDRPEVVYDENRLGRVLDEAEAALLASGIPIYQQYGRLVHSIRLDSVQEDEHGVRRRAGALLVREPTVERQPSWPVATTTLAGGAERKTGMPVWRATPPAV